MKNLGNARLLASVAAIGLGLSLGGGQALAQAATPQVGDADSEGLETIVVTAQRRTENLQNVPLSVVAVGGEQLKSSGIQTLESINRLAPNVVVERVGLFPGAASLSIRGVGYAGIESFTDPDVAVYTNGIYQARNATALAQTIDVAGIEILRGPQGTLFGRNAFAGAISVQTARPEMGVSKGSAGVTIGNNGLADMDFVGNLPIAGDKVAARIAVRQHNLAGMWHNNGITTTGSVDQTLKGKRAGRERALVVRPSLRFQPTENLDIQLIGEFLRERDQAAPILSAQLNGATIKSIGGVMVNPFGDKRAGIAGDGSDPFVTGFSLSDRPMDFDQSSYTADISYTMGIGKLRFLGNYQKTKSDVWADTDGSVANIFSSDRLEDYKGTSAELQYTSDFSDKLKLIAGALYFHDQYKTTQLSFTNTTSANTPAVFNVASYLSPNSATCFGNQSTAVTTGCTYPAYNVSYINNGGKRTAYAAYMQGEYHLSEPLSVVLGIRYSSERKYDYYGSNSTLAQSGLPLTIDPTLHTLPISDFLPNGRPLIYRADPYKNSNWAPRVGVNFKASEDMLLYAFWQRAFKSGGFNANAADLVAFRTPYGPETVDNYEAGMKAEFFDHKLRFNLNAFYGKYNGLQRSQVIASSTAPSGVTTVTSNTADLKSYGLELEVAARPTHDLTLFVNGAWNKAYYTRYCADLNGAEATATPALAPALAVCGPTTTVISSTGATTYLVPQDYSANRPLRAPRWDITAGFTQNFAIGGGNLAVTGSMNYRSSVDTDLLNRLYSFRPAMTVFDANIKWAPENNSYSISLWGRNLTKQVQVLGYTPVGNTFAFASPTAPRQYGVAMNVNF